MSNDDFTDTHTSIEFPILTASSVICARQVVIFQNTNSLSYMPYSLL
jgi:hypothetical protein